MADFSQNKKYNYLWQSGKFKDVSFSGSDISQFINDRNYITLKDLPPSSASLATGSLLTSASFSDPDIIFTKGDGSNFNVDLSPLTVLSASYAATASYVNPLRQDVIITGSLLVTQSYISTVDYIDFNTTPNTIPFLTGRIDWIDDTKTLNIDTDVNGFSIEVGHQNVVRARNTTGFNLTKGKIVYINGESGNRPTITTASWEGDQTSAVTLGWVAQNINDNQTGYVLTNGILRDINTSTYPPGTMLYLSSSGDYTSTIPVSPKHEVRLGQVVTQGVTGTIYVNIMNGYELKELHDVLITSSSNGDLVVKSGSLWVNSKQLTGSYGLTGSLEATSFTGSLYGTSSWANNALTASYLIGFVTSASYSDTASYVNPLIQDVRITGSLFISNSLDTFTRQLYNSNNINVLDWSGLVLNDSNTSSSLSWGNRRLSDNNELPSLEWDLRVLKDNTQNISLNWGGYLLADSKASSSVAWASRRLGDDDGITSISWGFRELKDPSGNTILDWSSTSSAYFTGSVYGTSSWAETSLTASYASTASYINGIIIKNNEATGGSFSGNPKKYTVTFLTAFPNTNYSVTITGEDSRTWTIESKLAGSFIINSNSNTALSNKVYWQAISYGEFNG